MKNILVVYSTGLGVDSTIIRVPMDYSPTDDDMELVKEKVVNAKRPKYKKLRLSSNYNITEEDGVLIPAEELVILNLQRLNI